MGTFHDNKSPLHGITVVVDTTGPKVFVGRCDDENAERVILVDADAHEDGQGGKSKADYVKRAAKFGVWKKFDHLVIPRADVLTITRLGDAQDAAAKAAAPAPAPKPVAPVEAPKSADGKSLVSLTPAAQTEVKRLLDQQNKPGTGLRLGVKGGGCSGFSYKPEYDSQRDGDIVVPFEHFDVFLDRKAVIYLRGITVDFQPGLTGKGFVFHNPNATNTCGCGESFSI